MSLMTCHVQRSKAITSYKASSVPTVPTITLNQVLFSKLNKVHVVLCCMRIVRVVCRGHFSTQTSGTGEAMMIEHLNEVIKF